MIYLFWCTSGQTQFRLAEFESIAALFDLTLIWVHKSEQTPWVVLDLKTEEHANLILSRSVMVKFCCQLWTEGNSLEDFHNNLKQFPFSDHSPLFVKEISFKIEVESYMKKISAKDKLDKVESLDYIPVTGPVNLANPDLTISYMEYFGSDHNDLPDFPVKVMIGRKVGDGQREKIIKQSIKTRKFIGNTTMDPQLSLLMANLGKVSPGSLVLDPFVGTGSILLAAAEFGGSVLGADIDFQTLHARTRPSRVGQKVRAMDESMVANFDQYSLSSYYLDVVAGDASQPPWRQDRPWLDCVLTDPPYGIRETVIRVGSDKDFSANVLSMKEKYQEHLPEKVSYTFLSMLSDLLNFSARNLLVGGRLVFWLPVIRQVYLPHLCPSHPCLQLVVDFEQVLSSQNSRRLIVMQRRKGVDYLEGGAIVSDKLEMFQDQWFIPVGKLLSKKERKERIKKYGHLNLTEAELNKIKSG